MMRLSISRCTGDNPIDDGIESTVLSGPVFIGTPGWVRWRAWSWLFSFSTRALLAGSGRPTTSSTLAMKLGLRERLMLLVRYGLSPWAAQILCTDDGAIPARAAMVRSLQWVAFGGFSFRARPATSWIFLAVSGRRPGGRVASFNSPSTPLTA